MWVRPKKRRLCDDYYGTTESCLGLQKLRKMITSQVKSDPNQIEKNLWMIIERVSSLFYNLYTQNKWVEDIRYFNLQSFGHFLITNRYFTSQTAY